jgi:hypothetical protein
MTAGEGPLEALPDCAEPAMEVDMVRQLPERQRKKPRSPRGMHVPFQTERAGDARTRRATC